MVWQIQKACKDAGEYELVIERQKNTFHCEQKIESWKWAVNYHGAQIASGSSNGAEAAKELAETNVPLKKP